VNEHLKQYCQDQSVQLLDLAEKIPNLEMPSNERDTMWDDGLHLTPLGYDRMGEFIYDTLLKIL